MEEFVNKSLLFVDNHSKPFLYYLHDLQLDFLVEQNRTQLEVSKAAIQFRCALCCRNDDAAAAAAVAQDYCINSQLVLYF